MQVTPYLTFNGQCAEAFEFYERCLGGKIEAMFTHGESPMAAQAPAKWRDKIMHARLIVGDQALMGSDATEAYEQPKGISVTLSIEAAAEAERVFNALADKGSVRMPIQETFWAIRFGVVVDRFGIPWMINCAKT